MTRYHRFLGLIVAGVCGMVLVSCGLSTDSTTTVDDTVTLLQDLKDRNVWETVSDRLITLTDQTSYHATMTLQSGPISKTGDFAPPLTTDITIQLEVDDRTNARITITENDQTTTYLVLNYTSDTVQPSTAAPTDNESAGAAEFENETPPSRIYRVDDAGFVCVTEGEHFTLLQGGIHTLFAAYRLEAMGMQTLVVVDKTDNEDALIGDRDAIEYDLVSRIEDARAIVAELENADLQNALELAGQFTLIGDLYLDEATLALLRVTSLYTDLSAQERHDLTFEITQWGGVDEIVLPTEAEIGAACN